MWVSWVVARQLVVGLVLVALAFVCLTSVRGRFGPSGLLIGRIGAAITFSLVVSLLIALIGVVLWIEGGPTPRTRDAWLLLVAIFIVAALPVLMCGLFC